MKEELENCPFCGDGADLIKSKLTNGYAVKCKYFSCQAVRTGSTKTKAIKAWNTRAQTKREAELVKALETSLRLVNRIIDKGISSGDLLKYKGIAQQTLSNHKQQEATKVTTLEDEGLTEDEFQETRHEYLEDRKFDQQNN